jgi:hypothetical protein
LTQKIVAKPLGILFGILIPDPGSSTQVIAGKKSTHKQSVPALPDNILNMDLQPRVKIKRFFGNENVFRRSVRRTAHSTCWSNWTPPTCR